MPPFKENKGYRKIKNQIQILNKQINESRCAVQNITSFEIDKKYKANIDSLTAELQSVASCMNTEVTKNKILQQIIFYLKAELQADEKERKNQRENFIAKKQKEICVEQINIDRILKKFNEETAKINQLKLMINSNRSERKLEKQIKFYQQQYKNQLLMSQAFKINYKKSWNFNKNLYISRAPSIYTQKQDYIDSVNKSSDYSEENSFNIFHLKNRGHVAKQISFQKQAKFHSVRDSKQKDPMRKTYKEQRLRYTKDLLQKISHQTNLLEQITIKSQSFTTAELTSRVATISQQNEDLFHKIEGLDCKINIIEDSVLEMKDLLNEMQYEEIRSEKSIEFATESALLLGFFVNSARLGEEDRKVQEIVGFLEDIAEVFDISLAKNGSGIPRVEDIRKIDTKISKLNQYCIYGRNLRSSQNIIGSETIVSSLLDKMQKFSDCDKIMDENLLKQQYYKQLGTRKNIKIKKQQNKLI